MRTVDHSRDRDAAELPGDRHDRRDRSEPAPHELASELTRDASVQERRPGGDLAAAERSDYESSDADKARANGNDRPRDQVLAPVERRIGRQMAGLIVGLVLVAVVVTAVLTRQWVLLGLGLLVFIPFALLLTMPYWLAATTKTAQDEAVRDQRRDAAAPPHSSVDGYR